MKAEAHSRQNGTKIYRGENRIQGREKMIDLISDLGYIYMVIVNMSNQGQSGPKWAYTLPLSEKSE